MDTQSIRNVSVVNQNINMVGYLNGRISEGAEIRTAFSSAVSVQILNLTLPLSGF